MNGPIEVRGQFVTVIGQLTTGIENNVQELDATGFGATTVTNNWLRVFEGTIARQTSTVSLNPSS